MARSAYHDHNWGRFRWGDDFGWEWGSVLPASSEDPWSLVFMRMTDRRRLRALSQALYVWRHDEPAAMFRDAAVQVRWAGLLDRSPDCTLPTPMRWCSAARPTCRRPSPSPRTERVTRSGPSSARESYARLAQPSELCLDRSVVLSETSGSARVSGSIDGETIDFVGAGVFELLHG